MRELGRQERVGLASISLKEAAWHLAHGRIRPSETFESWEAWLRMAAALPQLEVLPLTVDIAIESERFGEGFPPDPADRVIAATARLYDLTLITRDRPLRRYAHLRTLW
jgi:PIN domain nuclease of toxin-antitoxin system